MCLGGKAHLAGRDYLGRSHLHAAPERVVENKDLVAATSSWPELAEATCCGGHAC